MRRYEEQTLQQRDMIKELNDMRQLLAHHKVGKVNHNFTSYAVYLSNAPLCNFYGNLW